MDHSSENIEQREMHAKKNIWTVDNQLHLGIDGYYS